MSADPRGFAYGLEPVRRRRQWQLDAGQARLGRIEGALVEAREERDRLSAKHSAAQQEASAALRRRFDPHRHREVLTWLIWQRSKIERVEQQVQALEADRDAARREVLALQLQRDVIEAHREDCIADFVREDLRREVVEMDRDWLMRRPAATVTDVEVAP